MLLQDRGTARSMLVTVGVAVAMAGVRQVRLPVPRVERAVVLQQIQRSVSCAAENSKLTVQLRHTVLWLICAA